MIKQKLSEMRGNWVSILVACSVLILQSSPSDAADQVRAHGAQKRVTQVGDLKPSSKTRLHLAALLGYDMLSSGNQTAEAPSLGVAIGISVNPVWTLGVAFTTVNSTSPDLAQSAGATSALNILSPFIEYHFPGLEAMFLGIRGGAAMRSSSYTTPLAGSSNKFYFSYGPYAGWDFRLSNALSLAPQVGFTNIVAPVPINDIQIQLGVRYWP
jgi:hypothetical protein